MVGMGGAAGRFGTQKRIADDTRAATAIGTPPLFFEEQTP